MDPVRIAAADTALLALAVLLLWSKRRPGTERRYLIKSALSLCFVALGCTGAVLHPTRFRLWMAAGFLASLAGDELLSLYHQKHSQGWLAGGILAFAAAQVAFSGAFQTARSVLPAALIALVVLAAGLYLIVVFRLRPGRVLPLIAVYSLLAGFTFGGALWLALLAGGARQLLLAAGTALFLASDFLLLFCYFAKSPPRRLGAVNLALYYLAQLLLALAALLT